MRILFSLGKYCAAFWVVGREAVILIYSIVFSSFLSDLFFELE